METQIPYRTTIKSRPFLYTETKKLAELYLQELNQAQIKKKIINENIFQLKTDTRKREIATTISKRLQSLDKFLMEKIISSDTNTSKLIVLYAILKTDRLFYEFMAEVFSEKIAFRDLILKDHNFTTFFETKRQQNEKVASWKEYTFYKLKQVYIRILFEAGLLKNQIGNREIQIPIMNPDVLDHLTNKDPQYINAITGGE